MNMLHKRLLNQEFPAPSGSFRRDPTNMETAADLFPRTKGLLRYAIRREIYTRLSAMCKVLNDRLAKGQCPSSNEDCKFTFVPSSGGRFIPISGLTHVSDLGAAKIFTSPDGTCLAVVRHKSYRSRVDKTLRYLGASPFVQAEIHNVPLDSLVSSVKAMTGYQGKQAEDLSSLLSFAERMREQRLSLLLSACGNSEAKVDQVMELLEEAGAKVSQIRQLRSRLHASYKNTPEGLLAAAAYEWPMDRYEAICIDLLLSENIRFCEWKKKYLQEMKVSIGVGELEYTSKDAIWEIIRVLERLYLSLADEGDRASFRKKAAELDRKLMAFAGLVDKIDADIAKGLSKQEVCMEDIYQNAKSRIGILNALVEMYGMTYGLSPHHSYTRQLRQLISNMAVNLCLVSKGERDKLAELYAEKYFAGALRDYRKTCAQDFANFKRQFSKAYKGMGMKKDKAKEKFLREHEKRSKNFEQRMEKFLKNSDAEYRKVMALSDTAENLSKSFKASLKDLEGGIAAIIGRIAPISKAVSNILMLVYNDSKAHRNYKQEDEITSDFNYYLSRWDFLQVQQESMDGAQFDSMLRQLQQTNSAAYALCEKYGLGDEIRRSIQRFLYIKEKGFDMESDAAQIRENAYTASKLEVKYSVYPDEEGNISMELTYHNRPPLKIAAPSPEQDARLLEQDPSGPKDLDELLYGKKYPLSYVVEGLPESAHIADIYSKTSEFALSNWELYGRVREKLLKKDMSTAHFPYSLAGEDPMAGCFSNKLGQLPPSILKDAYESDYVQKLSEHYPDFKKEQEETMLYARLKTAREIAQYLNRSLPYWMQKCSEKIAQNSTLFGG